MSAMYRWSFVPVFDAGRGGNAGPGGAEGGLLRGEPSNEEYRQNDLNNPLTFVLSVKNIFEIAMQGYLM